MCVCVCLSVYVGREQQRVHVLGGWLGDPKKLEFRMLLLLGSLGIPTSECPGSFLFCSQKMEVPLSL